MNSSNTTIKQRIESLSKLSETDYPFISLYMNINAHELFEQAKKNRIFVKDSLNKNLDKIKKEKDREKWKSYQKDMEKIEDYIENNLMEKAHGLAIFACDKLGVFEAFQTIFPFENEFVVNNIPHLKQISSRINNYGNALVIMLSSKYSRIFNVRLEDFIVKETDTESDVHRFHKEGGWAQMRYQRHIENQVYEHYEEIANIATQFIDKENYDNIILIGQEYEIKNFRELLPKRINDKVIHNDTLSFKEGISEIIKTIINDLRREEKERKEKMVKDIIKKAMERGKTSLGIQNTLDLAKQERIQVLAVTKNNSHKGWKCENCFYMLKGQYKPECPQCERKLKETDLIEETVKLTYKNGGTVETVEDQAAEDLQKYEGIGAYLRY